MLKTTLRFLVIALIAVALGFLIYHVSQPAGIATVGSGINNIGGFTRELGDGEGFREGGSGLLGGLSGITGNLFLIAIVTLSVAALQKLLARRTEALRTN